MSRLSDTRTWLRWIIPAVLVLAAGWILIDWLDDGDPEEVALQFTEQLLIQGDMEAAQQLSFDLDKQALADIRNVCIHEFMGEKEIPKTLEVLIQPVADQDRHQAFHLVIPKYDLWMYIGLIWHSQSKQWKVIEAKPIKDHPDPAIIRLPGWNPGWEQEQIGSD